MLATTIISNITPAMRDNIKLLRYWRRMMPRLVRRRSTSLKSIAMIVPIRKLKPQISGLIVLEKKPPRLSSPSVIRYMRRYAAI